LKEKKSVNEKKPGHEPGFLLEAPRADDRRHAAVSYSTPI